MTKKTDENRINAGKVTTRAILVSLALVLAYVETLLPLSIGIPGAKIGLANLVTIVSLFLLGPADAFFISLARVLLSGILFSNMSAVLYSLAGFLLSFIVMVLLKRVGRFGITAVSCAGGVAHNIGQLLVAVLVAGTAAASYFPYLFACGTVAGIFIGFLGKILVMRLSSVVK